MTRSLGVKVAALILVICCGSLALAQTTTTALRGKVENENAGLPGVLVTLKSPVLQGERTTSTSANGDYSFSGIPAGRLHRHVHASGLPDRDEDDQAHGRPARPRRTRPWRCRAFRRRRRSSAEGRDGLDDDAGLHDASRRSSTNKLPVGRTILSVGRALVGPQPDGRTRATRPTISGGQTFDNLFTVDGAVVMDNIRGTPNNLFIEDAIQETTTSVNSVSAEYGRFTGGVVNTVTKSGGNQFSGSFRTTFTNDAWSAITPAQRDRASSRSTRSTRRRSAGRSGRTTSGSSAPAGSRTTTDAAQTVAPTNITYEHGDDEKRYQGKLTLTPFASQTFAVNYLKINQDAERATSSATSSTSTASCTASSRRRSSRPTTTASSRATSSSKALYSKRKFTFENSGSLYTDLIKGTLMRDRSNGNARYNSPTFCGVCDPEERDNKDYPRQGDVLPLDGEPRLAQHRPRVRPLRRARARRTTTSRAATTGSSRRRRSSRTATSSRSSTAGLVRLLHADRHAEQGLRRPDALGLPERHVARSTTASPSNLGVRYDKNDADGQPRRRDGERQRASARASPCSSTSRARAR